MQTLREFMDAATEAEAATRLIENIHVGHRRILDGELRTALHLGPQWWYSNVTYTSFG